jgi:hypothetical protein
MGVEETGDVAWVVKDRVDQVMLDEQGGEEGLLGEMHLPAGVAAGEWVGHVTRRKPG